MPVQPAGQSMPEKPTTGRKVWVINTGDQEYVEDFKGKTVTVPAFGEKALLMNVLEANRFLGRGVPPRVVSPTGKVLNYGKPLKIVELSEDEKRKHDSIYMSGAELVGEPVPISEGESAYKCGLCGNGYDKVQGLSTHVRKAHPEG